MNSILSKKNIIALLSFVSSLSTITLTNGHSWIDCLDTDRKVVYDHSSEWVFGGTAGHGKCKGYARNYPGRGNKDINTLFTYQMDRFSVENKGYAACQFKSEDGNYNGWRHQLRIIAGQTVYFAYLPNGHISKDRQARNTQYGIYWSGIPGIELNNTKQLTDDKLVGGKHDFDDGNCGETVGANGVKTSRAGDGKPCIGQFQIPANTWSGVYQFIWFWRFYVENSWVNNSSAAKYVNLAYSSCMDIIVYGNESNQTTISSNPDSNKVRTENNKKKNNNNNDDDETPKVTVNSEIDKIRHDKKKNKNAPPANDKVKSSVTKNHEKC